jgi:hypothetical protein
MLSTESKLAQDYTRRSSATCNLYHQYVHMVKLAFLIQRTKTEKLCIEKAKECS